MTLYKKMIPGRVRAVHQVVAHQRPTQALMGNVDEETQGECLSTTRALLRFHFQFKMEALPSVSFMTCRQFGMAKILITCVSPT